MKTVVASTKKHRDSGSGGLEVRRWEASSVLTSRAERRAGSNPVTSDNFSTLITRVSQAVWRSVWNRKIVGSIPTPSTTSEHGSDSSCGRLKSGGCWCNPNCSHHYLRFRQYPMGGHFTFNFLQRALTQASVTLKEAAISISGICHTRAVSPSNGMLNFLRLSPVISFACFRQKRALECTFLKQVRQLFIDFLCVGEFRVLSEWQLEHRMTRFSKRLSEWSLLMWSNSRGAASPSHSEIPHFSQHLALIPNWIKRSLTVQDLRGQSFFRVSKNDSFVIWEKV